MLRVKTYTDLVWHNIWDPDIDSDWVSNYFAEYNDTWPNIRPEIVPVAKEGCSLSSFTLRSLTRRQVSAVDATADGSSRLRLICSYGLKDWTGLIDENENEIRPAFTKDANGERLTAEVMESLGFFGYIDLPLLNILAVKIMEISRSLR